MLLLLILLLFFVVTWISLNLNSSNLPLYTLNNFSFIYFIPLTITLIMHTRVCDNSVPRSSAINLPVWNEIRIRGYFSLKTYCWAIFTSKHSTQKSMYCSTDFDYRCSVWWLCCMHAKCLELLHFFISIILQFFHWINIIIIMAILIYVIAIYSFNFYTNIIWIVLQYFVRITLCWCIMYINTICTHQFPCRIHSK